jgi:CMP-N-acetylneuraminic acid synthetase
MEIRDGIVNMPKVLAVIPARSGSKGIVDKNIRLCNGKPLLAHSIEHALKSNIVNRVIVSTDNNRYADIAREYGAEVPFLRPADISDDYSLDIDTFKHALHFLKKTEMYMPDLCVHLRPTHPVRTSLMIDDMVNTLIENPEWDSIRSVSPAPVTPYKMWFLAADKTLSPALSCEIPEAYNAPRQILPKVYMQNACIDIVRTPVILEKNSMTGSKIGGYIQDFDFDIDSEDEFMQAELYLETKEKILNGLKLTVCFDIDGIIAYKTQDNDYSKAIPNYNVINIVNKIYDMGHNVVIFTARGSATKIDWSEETKMQLTNWGLKFSKLRFGKPYADIYIDDRFLNLKQISTYI